MVHESQRSDEGIEESGHFRAVCLPLRGPAGVDHTGQEVAVTQASAHAVLVTLQAVTRRTIKKTMTMTDGGGCDVDM